MSSLLETLLSKTAEDGSEKDLQKFAEEVYSEGVVAGMTYLLEKIAEDLVTPGDSPAGNQVAMTIQKALQLSTGGDPQVLDTDEEAKEETEKEASETSLLQTLLAKLAEGEDSPTAEEAQHEAEVNAVTQEAHADLVKPEERAKLKDMVKAALSEME